MEYKDPGKYIPIIYLLYSWGSRFGVPSRVPSINGACATSKGLRITTLIRQVAWDHSGGDCIRITAGIHSVIITCKYQGVELHLTSPSARENPATLGSCPK